MDGVFMRKTIKIFTCLILVIFGLYMADVWQDKKALQENLIRLHVVANSDLQNDQEIKLKVRDAIVEYLQPLLAAVPNKEQAMKLVENNLSNIEDIANKTLEKLGETDCAVVSLGKEVFDTRKYDTFSLPAGVYDSLRIRIGKGEGKNWWCVVFPTLCLPATSDGVQTVATATGFSESLGNSLIGGNNLRFYILDCFGRIEKLFH